MLKIIVRIVVSIRIRKGRKLIKRAIAVPRTATTMTLLMD